MNIIDRTGERFGMLTVTGCSRKGRRTYYEYRCDCGKEGVAFASNMVSGHTQSCGCREGRLTHGLSRAPEYHRWSNLKSAGLLCERWHSFGTFIGDIGPRPSNRHAIVVVSDKPGPYAIGDIAWSVSRRKRCYRFSVRPSSRLGGLLSYGGEMLSMRQIAGKEGITRQRVYQIVKRFGRDAFHELPRKRAAT